MRCITRNDSGLFCVGTKNHGVNGVCVFGKLEWLGCFVFFFDS
jgi:hypothetical protein